MINYNRKKGTIGITIVMLVFGLLMAVAMSYHKTLQTETLVQNNSNYSDRAMDAAFSGVNYAMALLQSDKRVFKGDKIYLIRSDSANGASDVIKVDWISLNQEFENYLDEDRKKNVSETDKNNQKIPPYRFIVSCSYNLTKNYVPLNGDTTKIVIYIKSMGEYIKYEGNDEETTESPEKEFRAQILAKCVIDTSLKTIVLKSYKRVMLSNLDNNGLPAAEQFFILNDNEAF